MPVAAYTFQWTRAVCQLPDGLYHTVVLPSALGLASARFFASIGIAVATATASTPSRSRTVRCARERGGRPDPTSLDPACHPVLVSMVRGKGFPRRAPARSRTRRRHKGENKDGADGGLDASGKERIWARPWARAADHGERSAARARGQVRRITPGNPWCRPGPSPRVGGTRSAGPRRRPRRAQPARPRRCSRRSRRAARGRHHPTTGRTGWHRR